MNQHHSDNEREVDENDLEWHSVNYRDAPRDVVPQEQVDPETQRATMADLARRHAEGERFYFTPVEQVAFDADGRPLAYHQPPTEAITAFASQLHDERGNEEDP